jgi:hypothetical protein
MHFNEVPWHYCISGITMMDFVFIKANPNRPLSRQSHKKVLHIALVGLGHSSLGVNCTET